MENFDHKNAIARLTEEKAALSGAVIDLVLIIPYKTSMLNEKTTKYQFHCDFEFYLQPSTEKT